MTDYCKKFLVEPDKRFKMGKADPGFVDPKLDKSEAEKTIEANRQRIADGHMRLYAEKRQSLLSCCKASIRPARTASSRISCAASIRSAAA